ncbi:UNKNOWN [Stylonychia lemnae]|uniref:tRNA (GuanineN(7))methyltransferase n=1 Tax=Stylonychia lemnae TaxID=5949 RepID=A0A077ZPR1_STYLE|nr:UNKNOWN [Stylonychia lemnae]|eukprot:CDW71360.1 UNKNOWN [Stylonychia lemnae]
MSAVDDDDNYRKIESSYKYKPTSLSIPQVSRIPLLKALPYLRVCGCLLKKPKKDYRLALKKALLYIMDAKMPKNDLKLEKDPFLRLGFGMNVYFDTLKYLIVLMLLVFVFSLPSVFVYASYNGLAKQPMPFVTQFSLGNMECQSGRMLFDQFDFGIIPGNSKIQNFCRRNDITKSCSEELDQAQVQSYIQEKCFDKSECEIDVQKIRGMITNNFTAKSNRCLEETSNFFVQIPCTFHKGELQKRRIQGLIVGCIGIFISLFFLVYVDYLNGIFKNLYIEWDVNTVTAGDYSVELDISEKMWKNFIEKIYNPNYKSTKLYQFKKYLIKQLEQNFSRLPDLGFEDQKIEHIRISMITFAFDNSDLINLLKKRGLAIQQENYNKMREINMKIDHLKQKFLEKYNRPVTAFLTFENEEGINRCIAYKQTVTANEFIDIRTLLGQELNFKYASEPTDIIWENRHFTRWDRIKRTFIVVSCVLLLLSISFIIIFACSKIANKAILKYPAVDCDDVAKIQGNSFAANAFAEWDRNFDKEDKEKEEPIYMSTVKCFCEFQQKNDKFFTKYSLVDGVRLEDETNSQVQKPICYTYMQDKLLSYILGGIMSLAIVVINFVLRIVLINLIKWIGEDTYSQQLKSITNGIFIAQFLNTGFLMLLVQANLDEVRFPLGHSVFNGPFYDFLPLWYTAVGYKITQTMIINSVFPIIEFGIDYLFLQFQRIFDRSCGKDTYKTKMTNMQQYIDIYSGPEYLIHFKYSGILNVTFVTMMYGLGMPILFPIAAWTYFVLYSLERVLAAYFYQLPPTFDDQMSKNALMKMRWAAIFYLFFGFWMLSSKIVFSNQHNLIEDIDELMKSGHTIKSIRVDQASPLLLIGVCIFCIIFMQNFFKKTLKKWGFTFGGSKINVDQNLPFFFKSIRLREAAWLLKENKNLKEEYGFSIISREIEDTLQKIKIPKKAIQGVPYYIILANPLYTRDLHYICCDVPARDPLIKDDDDDDDNNCEQSDIVSIVLNMAFIPDEVLNQFKIQTGFRKYFRTAMDFYLAKKGKKLIKDKNTANDKIDILSSNTATGSIIIRKITKIMQS